jgi:hypothetical protein
VGEDPSLILAEGDCSRYYTYLPPSYYFEENPFRDPVNNSVNPVDLMDVTEPKNPEQDKPDTRFKSFVVAGVLIVSILGFFVYLK